MELNDTQASAVISSALAAFYNLDPGMTVARAQLLLTVVASPGITQKELEAKIKLSQAGISRNVLDLGEWSSKRDSQGQPRPGLGLVEQRPDLAYRKRLLVYPTIKGVTAAKTIFDAMRGALPRTSKTTKQTKDRSIT